MSSYVDLFNETDMDLDSAVIINLTADNVVITSLEPSQAVVTDTQENLISYPYSSSNIPSTFISRDINGSFSSQTITGIQGSFNNILGTIQTSAQPNITSLGTLTSLSVSGGTILTSITGSNLNLLGNLTSATANISGIISATTFTGAQYYGTIQTPTQPDITSLGTLTSLNVSGASGLTSITGTNCNLSGILTTTGANISGIISATTFTGAQYYGTIQTPSQPDITSVGTLTSLNVSGASGLTSITGTNCNLSGTLSVTGVNVKGVISATTFTGANYYGTIQTATQPDITSLGTLTSLNVSGASGLTSITGTNCNLSGILTTTGANIKGVISATTFTGANYYGTIETPAQPNITSLGTLTSLNVSGGTILNAITGTNCNLLGTLTTTGANISGITSSTGFTGSNANLTSMTINQINPQLVGGGNIGDINHPFGTISGSIMVGSTWYNNGGNTGVTYWPVNEVPAPLLSYSLTNGQIIIGATGTDAVVNTITGSAGIRVFNGAGTIIIDGANVTGSQGFTGTQGIQGIQGVTGIQGATGVQGSQGVTGTQGITGSYPSPNAVLSNLTVTGTSYLSNPYFGLSAAPGYNYSQELTLGVTGVSYWVPVTTITLLPNTTQYASAHIDVTFDGATQNTGATNRKQKYIIQRNNLTSTNYLLEDEFNSQCPEFQMLNIWPSNAIWTLQIRAPAGSSSNICTGVVTCRITYSNGLNSVTSWLTSTGSQPQPGMLVWLDGQDPSANGILPSNGSSVATWFDKSGNANNAGNGTSPIFSSAGGFGGLPSLDFTGSAYYHSTMAVPLLSSSLTYFVVAQSTTTVTGTTSLEGIPTGANNDNVNSTQLIASYQPNSTTIQPFAGGSLSSATVSGPGTGYVFASLFDGVHQTSYSNNVAGTPVAFTTTINWQVMNVGTRWNSGAANTQYKGYIAEIIVYNSALSTTQISAVNNYLFNKWNI